MKKVTIAICDVQDTYRERLAEYFIRRKGEQTQVFTFSGRRAFVEKSKENTFDIVLCGKGFEEIQKKLESDSLYIFLSETPDLEEEKEAAVFKYQSAEEIWREMFSYYMKLGKNNSYICRSHKEIIGVYSPNQSRMRTPFALTLAQLLAVEEKVLYVNLSEWAGFEYWMEENYHRDLADLMYLISDYGVKVRGILESVVCSINRMDYIPPMEDAQLLMQIAEEDYQMLFRLLQEKTDYSVIILDFGVMISGFFNLLSQCTGIYGIADQGMLARGQYRQFEKSMQKEGLTELAEKMIYVPFSAADAQMMEQEPVMQQWVYGRLGDRVRAARYGQYGTKA